MTFRSQLKKQLQNVASSSSFVKSTTQRIRSNDTCPERGAVVIEAQPSLASVLAEDAAGQHLESPEAVGAQKF